MKKRKILYLFPLAALVLSGCTFQEGWETAKTWMSDHIFTPIANLFNGGSKDSGKKPSGGNTPAPSTDSDTEEVVATEVGSVDNPLTVSQFQTLCDENLGSAYDGIEDKKSVTDFAHIAYLKAKVSSNTWNSDGTKIQYLNLVDQTNSTLQVTGMFVVVDQSVTGDYSAKDSLKGLEVIVKGYPALYKKSGAKTYELVSKDKSDTENPRLMKVFAPEPTPGVNYGSLEAPLTVSEAKALINQEHPTKVKAFVTGEVTSNTAWEAGNYNNVLKIIITDGENELTIFKCATFPDGYNKTGITADSLKGKIVVANGFGEIYQSTTYELTSPTVFSISDPAPVEVESVSLSQYEVSMEVDDLVSLEAFVHPEKANQEVNWTIEQSGDVVSFNEETGVITALSVGTATITATSVENADAHASCIVTVSEKTKILSDIVVDTSNVKTKYNVNDPYSTEGIVVTAKYSNAEDQDVTAGATITCDKQTAAAGDEQLTITVSYGGIEKEIVLGVQVTAKSSLQIAYEAAIAGETGVFTFEGTVVSVTGKSYVLQDGDYAINIYNKETEGVALNKLVQVVSTLKLYQGCPQTNSITSATVTGEGVAQTSASVASKADLDALNHNVLAHVDDAIFVSDNGDWASGSTKQFVFAIGGDNITVSFDKQGYDAAKAAIANAAIAGDHFELSGLITAAYSGTNQLTFTGTSGIVKTSSAPVPDPATVTITSGDSLAVGSSMTLTATVGPEGAAQDVAWEIVTGGEFASLSDGVLTGDAAGDVKVKATAVGFESVYAEKTINIFETSSDSVTAKFSAEDLIEDPSATYTGGSVKLESHKVDEVLTVSVTGGRDSGKIYKSNDYGFQIRLYNSSSDTGVLTVSVADGYEIVSATAYSADAASGWWGAPSDVPMSVASDGQSASINGKIAVYYVTVVYQPAQ